MAHLLRLRDRRNRTHWRFVIKAEQREMMRFTLPVFLLCTVTALAEPRTDAKGEPVGERYAERWQGRKHYLLDGTDTVSEWRTTRDCQDSPRPSNSLTWRIDDCTARSSLLRIK